MWRGNMTELSDELVDKIENYLRGKKINLHSEELNQIRDMLDSILENYEDI